MHLLSRTLLKGAILLLPALITIWLLTLALANLDDAGITVLKFFGWAEPWRGGGLILIVLLMLLAGTLLRSNPLLGWLHAQIERLFMSFPLVKTVYGTTRDVVRLMDKDGKRAFKQTVLVDIPGLGPTVGFITVDHLPKVVADKIVDANERVPVYIPMGYQIGGYTVFVRRKHTTPVDWSFEEAMRFVMTAGVSGTDD